MNLKKRLRQLCIIIGLGLLVFFSLRYCAHKIDESRAEKKERNEKLEAGTCEFDKADLDNLLIKNGHRTFKPLLEMAKLKALFSDDLVKLDINDTSKTYTYRIDNNDFTFYKKDNLAAIGQIDLDLSSRFSFQLSETTTFSPEYKLDEFEEQFPKSFSCRESILTSNVTEYFAVRIDNRNLSSDLKFIVLYFDHAEKLHKIEFYHEGIHF